MPEPSSSAGSASTTKPTPPDGAPCQRARAGTLRGSPCQAASRLLRFAAPLRVTRRPAQRRVCRWPEAGFRPPATRNPHPALTPAQTQTTVTNFTAFPTRNPSSEACAFRLISLLEWTVRTRPRRKAEERLGQGPRALPDSLFRRASRAGSAHRRGGLLEHPDGLAAQPPARPSRAVRQGTRGRQRPAAGSRPRRCPHNLCAVLSDPSRHVAPPARPLSALRAE